MARADIAKKLLSLEEEKDRKKQLKAKLLKMKLAGIENITRKADKPVSDVLSKLPNRKIHGISPTESRLEGKNEIGDKRVKPSIVDDRTRHNKSGTFIKSFSKENAKKFAAISPATPEARRELAQKTVPPTSTLYSSPTQLQKRLNSRRNLSTLANQSIQKEALLLQNLKRNLPN
jgi:hypothetical protein